MRYFLIFSVLIFFTACGPGSGFQVSSLNPQTDISAPVSGSAFELYSWYVDGSWHYVLFETATRITSFADLTGGDDTIIGTDEMTDRLLQLPRGAKVYWNLKRIKGFSLPDRKVLEKASNAAAKADIHLEIIPWPA